MARSKKDFNSGSLRPEDGIVKPAVEREALRGGGSTARNQPTPVKPKIADPDRPSVFSDNTVLDEKDIAPSRRRYVLGGGTVSDKQTVPRVVTTPTDRNATSKEALAKLNEHYTVLNAFATTHSGSIRTAARQLPSAFKDHTRATKSLSDVSTNLALAKEAFAGRNSAKGNGHLQSAIRSLISAHKSLSSKNVREITGAPVSIHPDELSSWKDHVSKLPAFRRQGKPFERVNVGGLNLNPNHPDVVALEKDTRGTIVAEKINRARTGSPRTPKWERDLPGRSSRSERMSSQGSGAKLPSSKGSRAGEAVDSATRGTISGTTGELDPRRKGSKKTRIETTIRRPNLPKIGDTIKKAKPAMKPGDTVEGK